MRHAFAILILALALAPTPSAQRLDHNVVLVTLDGARTDEMFGGLDLEVLRSRLDASARVEDQPIYKRFWAADPVARREKLMPFFWGTLMREHGSIAGNPALGSRVRLANRHWFSYPGYSEMLVGRTNDEVITSNDPVRNPSRTVLEILRDQFALSREQVALFGSWTIFNAIGESREGAVTINAGFEPYEHPDPQIKELSALQLRTPTPWNSVRHDAYTARFAFAHMATFQPRVLHLALGETDDWAHDGRYDRVLEAFAHTDEILRQLWTTLQADPQYRGKTSLLITTDHGRGAGADGWRHHGDKYASSANTWMAFIAPSMSQRGEWRDHAPIETRQVAATLLGWMGVDWRTLTPQPAPPITPPAR
jgi:hypothetical protein